MADRALSAELLRWIQSLNLSFPVKDVKRDFSDGFTIAEILAEYYPKLISTQSFARVASRNKKAENWDYLSHLFKVIGFKLPTELDADWKQSIVACTKQAVNCVRQLLIALHAFLERSEENPVDELFSHESLEPSDRPS